MRNEDRRPPVWIGHVTLATDRLGESRDFLAGLGMRLLADGEDHAVFELRGGTHLVLLRRDDVRPGRAGFDLMVEDIDATWKQLAGRGLDPSPIEETRFHRSFRVRDPSGQEITFNSDHTSKLPV